MKIGSAQSPSREAPRAQLVLASGSPRRAQLLRRLDCEFACVVSDVDESQCAGAPRDVAVELARAKATAVRDRLVTESAADAEGVWVLGADTVVALGDEMFGKPVDVADATRMLTELSGRCHTVYTGVALCRGDVTQRAVEATHVAFRRLRDAEISAYVTGGEPLGKAGAYGIQGEGEQLVEGFDGCFYNVVGLPLTLTASWIMPFCGSGARRCDCRSHPLQRGAPRCDPA